MKNEMKFIKMGYSQKAAALILSKENFGKIKNPDITFTDIEKCGDVLTIYLKISKDKIIDSSYESIGCVGLQLSATILTKMLKGIHLKDALKIKFVDILNFAEKIPQDKHECIYFTLKTLKKAILANKMKQNFIN